MKKTLRILARSMNLDAPVLFMLLARGGQIGEGLISLLLIAHFFTPEVQGFYYTFGAILSLKLLVELHLATVIIQFASHEWSKLSLDDDRRIVGNPAALARLVSLGRLMGTWYAAGSGIMVVLVGPTGYLFFSRSSYTDVDWVAPWFAVCILSALNLCFVPVWAILEGCNQVADVYKYRFFNSVLGAGSMAITVMMGGELWAAAASAAVALLWSAIYLTRRYWSFLGAFLHTTGGPTLGWREEIWPMQWRMAISALSGYFISFLFTPAAFHFSDAVVAGQVGMTLNLATALTVTAASWVAAKTPRFGMLIAKKDYTALDRLFFRSATFSFLVTIAGAAAIEGAVIYLKMIHHPLSSRALPPLETGLFLIAAVLMQSAGYQAIYLRAHKREPLAGCSVVVGLLTAISTVGLGSRFGATGMAAGYLAVTVFNALLVPVIWQRSRTAWHRDVAQIAM